MRLTAYKNYGRASKEESNTRLITYKKYKVTIDRKRQKQGERVAAKIKWKKQYNNKKEISEGLFTGGNYSGIRMAGWNLPVVGWAPRALPQTPSVPSAKGF